MSMKNKSSSPHHLKNGVTQAAGGLVWQQTEAGPRLAVIHRPRYDDWALPKGKLEKGETFQECALREVSEETGLAVRLGDFAGCVGYQLPGWLTPKIVLYWHMDLAGPPDFIANAEVDRLEWLSAQEALERLSYADEREVVMKAMRSK